jgi:hypothetical protein
VAVLFYLIFLEKKYFLVNCAGGSPTFYEFSFKRPYYKILISGA